MYNAIFQIYKNGQKVLKENFSSSTISSLLGMTKGKLKYFIKMNPDANSLLSMYDSEEDSLFSKLYMLKDGSDFYHSSNVNNSFKYVLQVSYLNELNGGFEKFSAGHNVDDIHIHAKYLKSLQ